MNQFMQLLASVCVFIGGASMVAGIAYLFWLMWSNPAYAFFNLLVPAMIVAGVIVLAIGLVIRSSRDSG